MILPVQVTFAGVAANPLRALVSDPRSTRLHFELGTALKERGDHEELS